MSDVVIKVENLYKEYRLGTISHGTLQQDLQSWWSRIRGKEDPNSIITSVHPTQGTKNQEPRTKNNFDHNPHMLALNDVSFEVKRGEVLGIIGRNGAGKSTLLKILSEVTTPTKGTVKIKGRIASLLEVGTGFHPELTGRENIYLNGTILGMKKTEIDRKFDEIVDFAEIEKFIDTPVKRYSSGMYVRLAFAVAAHLEPEILIVDEVLAVGDAQFQKKCLGKMGEVSKEGRTVLFVSHNMAAIRRLCGNAILLSYGNIVSSGEVNEVVLNYLSIIGAPNSFEAVFAEHSEMPYQILSVGLYFKNGQVVNRPIEIDEKMVVRIKLKLKKILPGGYATLVLRDYGGQVIILSDNRDSLESICIEEKGIYEVEIEMPSPLLAPGKYTLATGLGKASVGAVDHTADVICFEVIDSKGSRANRPGFIHMPFQWRLKKNTN